MTALSPDLAAVASGFAAVPRGDRCGILHGTCRDLAMKHRTYCASVRLREEKAIWHSKEHGVPRSGALVADAAEAGMPPELRCSTAIAAGPYAEAEAPGPCSTAPFVLALSRKKGITQPNGPARNAWRSVRRNRLVALPRDDCGRGLALSPRCAGQAAPWWAHVSRVV